MGAQNIIQKLMEENDYLRDKIIDLEQEKNFSKERELLEFIGDLLNSLDNIDNKLSKEEIIENLKEYIREFIKKNNLKLF